MGARNGFKLQDTASLFNLLGQFDQLIRSVAEDEVWVQIPVTRSNRKGAVSASFFFFHQFPRTLASLRHTMIVETGSPRIHYFIFRRHTMNNCLCNVFDNNNWIWIILIVLLFTCCCGGC